MVLYGQLPRASLTHPCVIGDIGGHIAASNVLAVPTMEWRHYTQYTGLISLPAYILVCVRIDISIRMLT